MNRELFIKSINDDLEKLRNESEPFFTANDMILLIKLLIRDRTNKKSGGILINTINRLDLLTRDLEKCGETDPYLYVINFIENNWDFWSQNTFSHSKSQIKKHNEQIKLLKAKLTIAENEAKSLSSNDELLKRLEWLFKRCLADGVIYAINSSRDKIINDALKRGLDEFMSNLHILKEPN